MTATTHGSTGIARQPATAVFEHASGLLASAQALEPAARTSGAEAAIGPMLACLELTFEALMHAVGHMRGHALESFARSGTDRDIRLASAEAEQGSAPWRLCSTIVGTRASSPAGPLRWAKAT
jgi:hypothetical protein